MRFQVWAPSTLSEAVNILSNQENTSLYAGSTDLLVKIKNGVLKPAGIVCLNKVAGLNTVEFMPGRGLTIGPLVTHAQIASHAVVNKYFTALSQACNTVGSPQIRNLGTVAGNLANASPAADTAPALLALGARVVMLGVRGRREIGLAELFKGPGLTVLERGELIEQIFVPEYGRRVRSVYLKLGRRKALEIAVCSVALAGTPAGEHWKNVSLALGAVAPTPILAKGAGVLLEQNKWSGSTIDQAVQEAKSCCCPVDDVRASAGYRREMIGVLVKRAVKILSGQGAELDA